MRALQWTAACIRVGLSNKQDPHTPQGFLAPCQLGRGVSFGMTDGTMTGDLMRFGMDLGLCSRSKACGVCGGIASYRCGRTPQGYDSAKKIQSSMARVPSWLGRGEIAAQRLPLLLRRNRHSARTDSHSASPMHCPECPISPTRISPRLGLALPCLDTLDTV